MATEQNFANSDVKILLCPGEPRETREAVKILTGEAERRKTHFPQCALLLRQLEGYRRMIAPAFEGRSIPWPRSLRSFSWKRPRPSRSYCCWNVSKGFSPGNLDRFFGRPEPFS